MGTDKSESPAVELRNVSKRYGAAEAVRCVNLEISRGEMFSLLGPSGCGKTTTLRMVAGFVEPSSGEIRIRGQAMTSIPSYRRNTAMVFQNYALFPHLSAFDNVAFGLKMRGVTRDEIATRVRAVLSMVHMEPFHHSYPRQLSGGQQQRVALARALVVNPDVLLLDEPLSSLDVKLRLEVRSEIRDLVKRLGMTAIYVTHDQEEALAISDRLAVMQHGVVEQVGTPVEIYDRPNTVFVASFIGTANVFSGQIVDRTDGLLRVRTDSNILMLAADSGQPSAQTVAIVVRPERIKVGPEAARTANHLEARVIAREFVGETVHYLLELTQGVRIRLHQQYRSAEVVLEGSTVTVGWSAEDTRIIALARRDISAT